MLPFFINSRISPLRLFELEDGRFQLLDDAEISPFLPGYGYLLVEHRLAEFLVEHDVEQIVCEDAVLFDRPSGKEFRSHARVRVKQYFTSEQINDLDLTGLRLLTMDDENYFVSRELKELLQRARFDYLSFSEGLEGFGGINR